MLSGLNFASVRVIATYWMRFAIRTGGGLMSLLVILSIGLTAATFVVKPAEMSIADSAELGHTEESAASDIDRLARSDGIVELIEQVTGESKEQAQYLMKEQPALLSAIFLVLLMVFPFMMCLSGFNQTAGEIGSRGLRYLLLRTSRANIFLGRFLGAFVFAAAATALMCGVLICYVGIKLNVYPLGELLWWGFQGYLALLLLGVAYLALCSWISAALDSAFGSLALCVAAVAGSLIVALMANLAVRGNDLDWIYRLLPWGWKFDLLSGDVGTRLLAYAVMLGFTGLFLGLGLRTFTKRDL